MYARWHSKKGCVQGIDWGNMIIGWPLTEPVDLQTEVANMKLYP